MEPVKPMKATSAKQYLEIIQRTHQQGNGGQCVVGIHKGVGHLIYTVICFTISIETNANSSTKRENMRKFKSVALLNPKITLTEN